MNSFLNSNNFHQFLRHHFLVHNISNRIVEVAAYSSPQKIAQLVYSGSDNFVPNKKFRRTSTFFMNARIFDWKCSLKHVPWCMELIPRSAKSRNTRHQHQWLFRFSILITFWDFARYFCLLMYVVLRMKNHPHNQEHWIFLQNTHLSNINFAESCWFAFLQRRTIYLDTQYRVGRPQVFLSSDKKLIAIFLQNFCMEV